MGRSAVSGQFGSAALRTLRSDLPTPRSDLPVSRRPGDVVAAPPEGTGTRSTARTAHRETGPAAVAGLVVLGVMLPVFGASLLVVLVLDQVLRRVPVVRQFFNVV